MTLKTALYGALAVAVVCSYPFGAARAADATLLSISGNAYASLGLPGATYDYAEAMRYAPQFTQSICSVRLNMYRSGSPSDLIELDLIKGGATPDGGGLMAGVQVAITSTSPTAQVFAFPYCQTLVPGTIYWIKINRTGTGSFSNYYNFQLNTSDVTGYTTLWRANTTAFGGWGDASPQELSYTLLGVDFGGGSQTVIFPQPTSTATSTVYVSCDPNSSVFQYSLCSMFTYLFVPPPAAFTDFQNLGGKVAAKPPLGYFTLIQVALLNVSSSASSSAYTLPDLTPLDTPFFSPVRQVIKVGTWTALGFWIFHFARTITL